LNTEEFLGVSCHDELCRALNQFRGEFVSIHTQSGDVIEGELQEVTFDCLVKVIESVLVSPFEERRLTVIRCRDIESFSVNLPE